MNEWTLIKSGKKSPILKSPVLIEGLPGIGNVGKVAVDFIIEEVGAEKMCEIFSYKLPHSVFVNDANLVELPSISLYSKRIKKKDFIFLAGDVQPIDALLHGVPQRPLAAAARVVGNRLRFHHGFP